MILDGRSKFSLSLGDFLQRRGCPPSGEVAPDAAPARAEVNHGRWVALCPACGGAEYVWWEDPRFFCVGCRNAAIGGRWRPLAVPDDRARIEAVLSVRPDPMSRNWLPDEPPAALLAENDARGVSP